MLALSSGQFLAGDWLHATRRSLPPWQRNEAHFWVLSVDLDQFGLLGQVPNHAGEGAVGVGSVTSASDLRGQNCLRRAMLRQRRHPWRPIFCFTPRQIIGGTARWGAKNSWHPASAVLELKDPGRDWLRRVTSPTVSLKLLCDFACEPSFDASPNIELRSNSAIWSEQARFGRHIQAEAAFSVEEPYRRRGIGEKLIKRIQRAATNHGVETIEIICLPAPWVKTQPEAFVMSR